MRHRPLAALAVLALSLVACRSVERQPRFLPGPELALVPDAADRRRIGLAVDDLFGTPETPLAPEGSGLDLGRVERGRRVYAELCILCHGPAGGGDGALAARLDPGPRDFRRGVFKFTSTAPGARAVRADLLATLRRGVPPKMPSLELLKDEATLDVVELVLWLSQRGEVERRLVAVLEPGEAPSSQAKREAVAATGAAWSRAESQVTAGPRTPPPMTRELAQWGRELFVSKEAACAACHGADGRGQGPSAQDLKDDWGAPDPPRDLTAGVFRGGGEPMDLYRTIAAGLKGSPMPAFKEALGSDQIWNLVAYVRELGGKSR